MINILLLKNLIRYNSNQGWNNDKCQCNCEKHHIQEKEYAWNPSPCNYENEKYLASIMDDSAFICDEVIDAEAKLNSKVTKLSLKDGDDKTEAI